MFVLKTKITYLVKLTPTTSTTTTTTSTQTEPTSTQTDPTSTQAEPTSTPSEPTLTQTDPWYGASDGSSSPSQEPNPTSEGPLEPTSEEPSSSSYTTDLPPEPQINSQARIPLLATRRNFVEVIDIADVQVTRRKLVETFRNIEHQI